MRSYDRYARRVVGRQAVDAMRKLGRVRTIASCIAVVLLLLSGCQPARRPVEMPAESRLILTGAESFPEGLAGRWLDERMSWDIVVDRQGRISEIIHSMGRVTVRPGEITKVPLIKGGEGMMRPGEWVLQYDAESREMLVSIDIDSMRFQVGAQIVEGSCRDVLYGTVSEDGRTWVANWNTYPKYFVTTEEFGHKELPMDEHLQDMGVITFKRAPEEDK